jgi:hypothetical protein
MRGPDSSKHVCVGEELRFGPLVACHVRERVWLSCATKRAHTHNHSHTQSLTHPPTHTHTHTHTNIHGRGQTHAPSNGMYSMKRTSTARARVSATKSSSSSSFTPRISTQLILRGEIASRAASAMLRCTCSKPASFSACVRACVRACVCGCVWVCVSPCACDHPCVPNANKVSLLPCRAPAIVSAADRAGG